MRREKKEERNCHVRCGGWKDSGKERTEESPNPAFQPVGERGASVLIAVVFGCKNGNSHIEQRMDKRQLPPPQSAEIMASQHDTATEERATLSLVILMTSKAYRRHLKALRITEERKTRATYTDMSLFGLKRTRCAES